jgi:hypothetical protein
MITDKCSNKEIIKNLYSLLKEINFRLEAFENIEKCELDPKTVEFMQDLIIYDLKTIMDDDMAIFPFH